MRDKGNVILEKQPERIISGLRRFELTEGERRFVELVADYFNQTRTLTEQQKSILKGIYRDKIEFPGKTITQKGKYNGGKTDGKTEGRTWEDRGT